MSVGLPRHFRLCLVMNSVLMLLCTGSILSLVAVTVDRFWAIVRPLRYSVDMTRRRALVVIAVCWLTATVIGLLPAAGWNAGEPRQPRCFFMEVMDFRYLAFVYFATIVAPSLFMAVVYAVIFKVVRRQVRPSNSDSALFTHTGGMLSLLPTALMRQVMQSPPPVCLSLRPSVRSSTCFYSVFGSD